MELDPQQGASRSLTGAVTQGEDDELPMVVWLRGDEPFFEEFALDADQVMAQLGIRRSRLTQISGRELRVGRVRRGRYITPVFRQVDVDAYMAWTRPSVSHVKSSNALSEASEELKQESRRFAEELRATVELFETGVQGALRQGLAKATAALSEQLAAWRAAHDEAFGRLEVEGTSVRRDLEQQSREIAAIKTRLDEQSATLMMLARDVGELGSLMRTWRDDGRQAQETQRIVLEAFGSELERLAQRKDEEALVQMIQGAKPTRHKSLAEARRITRLGLRLEAEAPRVRPIGASKAGGHSVATRRGRRPRAR